MKKNIKKKVAFSIKKLIQNKLKIVVILLLVIGGIWGYLRANLIQTANINLVSGEQVCFTGVSGTFCPNDPSTMLTPPPTSDPRAVPLTCKVLVHKANTNDFSNLSYISDPSMQVVHPGEKYKYTLSVTNANPWAVSGPIQLSTYHLNGTNEPISLSHISKCGGDPSGKFFDCGTSTSPLNLTYPANTTVTTDIAVGYSINADASITRVGTAFAGFIGALPMYCTMNPMQYSDSPACTTTTTCGSDCMGKPKCASLGGTVTGKGSCLGTNYSCKICKTTNVCPSPSPSPIFSPAASPVPSPACTTTTTCGSDCMGKPKCASLGGTVTGKGSCLGVNYSCKICKTTTVCPSPSPTPYPVRCSGVVEYYRLDQSCSPDDMMGRYIYFKCIGASTERVLGGSSSCKTEDNWRAEAASYCLNNELCIATPSPSSSYYRPSPSPSPIPPTPTPAN